MANCAKGAENFPNFAELLSKRQNMTLKNKKVLVTGGAGYIGSVLVRLLLEDGYHVRILDMLMFGGEPVIDLLDHDRIEFLKGDVREEADVRKALEGIDYVAHLAAIVGDPACAKQPDLARSINLDGTRMVYDLANEMSVQKFVFASTCSNYGKMKDPNAFVREDSELAPVSLYAETKVEIEKYLLGQDKNNTCKPTCLRFSTVYGLSSRIRFDLTVNEFTRELALGRELVIFGEQFWRPYCHVRDLSRSVIAVFNATDEQVAFDVFNVGDTNENYTKQMIVNEISDQIPDANISYVKKDEDPRDYRVNFDKIRDKLDFRITMRVPDGIRTIKQALDNQFITDPDNAKYRNV